MIKKTATVLFAVLLSVSCASKKSSQRLKIFEDYSLKNNLNSVAKIKRFLFRDWNYLDNRHLIITNVHRQDYLIGLMSYCYDLEFTQVIALKQAVSSQLSTKSDAIIVPKQQMQQDCRIKTIHELSPDQVQELQTLLINP